MGNFFTSTQIYNNEKLNREEFIENFCRKMAEEGYVTCDSDESKLSYILRFADNCKWVTITSEAYEQGNEVSKKDTGRIAKMLGAPCVNTVVIDSDCAILELYDKNGKKADMFTIGRADDYFGDGNPQPSEKVWKPFISKESSWEQFNQVCGSDEVFVEDGLSKLAPIIGMNSCNITFSAEDADEIDTSCAFLDFKSARSFITMSRDGKTVETQPQKFTINAAFKQIFGDALEPYGFKTIKGRYPYLVRLINNEILHVITFYPENPYYPYDKAFAVVGGVATIYRKRISLDKSPKQNHEWLAYASSFYASLFNEPDRRIMSLLYVAGYNSDSTESMVTVLKELAENVKKFVLPVLDKVKDIDSCLDYLDKFKMPRNHKRCTEICTYYPDEDECFLNFLSDKRISERPDFLENYLNDSEFHNWVLTEIKKRKTENIAILKESGLFEQPENEKAEQKKLTLKSAFTQVFGETLEPLGFVKLKKTKEPCYVRIVGDGIINVITYRTLSAYKTGYKNVEILLGILSLYNPELIFLDDHTCSLYCIQGLYNSDYYRELGIKPRNETIDNVIDFECKLWDINKNFFSDPEVRKSEFDKRIGHCLCSTSDSEILLRALNNTCDVIKDVVLPIMEKIKDNKEYIEYCYSLRRDVKLSTDINDFRKITCKDGNGLLLIKENYTADTSKYTERDLAMYVDAIEQGRRGLGDAANIEDFRGIRTENEQIITDNKSKSNPYSTIMKNAFVCSEKRSPLSKNYSKLILSQKVERHIFVMDYLKNNISFEGLKQIVLEIINTDHLTINKKNFGFEPDDFSNILILTENNEALSENEKSNIYADYITEYYYYTVKLNVFYYVLAGFDYIRKVNNYEQNRAIECFLCRSGGRCGCKCCKQRVMGWQRNMWRFISESRHERAYKSMLRV